MKLILCVVLCIYSVTSYSQVYKFSSFATSQTIRNDNGKITHQAINRETKIPIILDYDSNRLKTFGELPLNINFFKVMSSYEDKDGNAIQKIAGRDRNGNKCAVVIIIYKHPLTSGGVAMIDISYPNMDLAYEVKKQE